MKEKENKKKRIYFAHSKLIYDTVDEQNILAKLSLLFERKSIVCPNNDMGELGSIEPYLKMIDTLDVVICHPLDKFIGKGQYEEIMHAFKSNKPVYAITYKDFIFKLTEILSRDVKLVKTDWKRKYASINTV